MHAIDCGFSLDTIKELVRLGVNVNTKDEQNETCLNYCVIHENIQCFKYLITLVGEPDKHSIKEEVKSYVKEPLKG